MKSFERRIHWDDVVVQALTAAAALVAATSVVIIGAFLISAAMPAIRFNGAEFFQSLTWNPGNQYGNATIQRNGVIGEPGASFGALVFIYGTICSSVIAMIIATPIAILTALALVYRVPAHMRTLADTVVELMAGVPSVVYGLWGIVVVVPWIGQQFGPFVTQHFGAIPFLGGSAGSGNGLFAAAVILAIMVLPIMAATMRDMIANVPQDLFEASMALGATTWQTVSRVIVPSVWRGMVGSGMLALGRALGETMAVLMVGGGALNELPQNIFAPINTMAAVIVSQLDSALTDSTGLSIASLAELALVLFGITLAVNLIARYIVRRTAPVRF